MPRRTGGLGSIQIYSRGRRVSGRLRPGVAEEEAPHVQEIPRVPRVLEAVDKMHAGVVGPPDRPVGPGREGGHVDAGPVDAGPGEGRRGAQTRRRRPSDAVGGPARGAGVGVPPVSSRASGPWGGVGVGVGAGTLPLPSVPHLGRSERHLTNSCLHPV